MPGIGKRAISVVRSRVNSLSRYVIRSEATRKALVVNYYALRVKLHNIWRIRPVRNAEELLSWQKTMSLKVDFSQEVYRGNVFYGIGKALREYCESPFSLKACIEHGVYFGKYVNSSELDNSDLPALVTLSPVREQHVREVSSVPVCKIGPYIAYSSGYLDKKEVTSIRASLGKTMLVFPSHSVDFVDKHFEIKDLIAEIERVRTLLHIQTVLVSIYYRDLLNGAAEAYEDAGYTVVTSGYREDSNFLQRQRTLIELADFTFSNSVGTHVGYCLYLGKPHYIYVQPYYQTAISKADSKEFLNCFAASESSEKSSIQSAFSHVRESITNEQLDICDYYWGFSSILSKKEMKLLFDLCEKAHSSKPNHRQRALREVIREHTCDAGFERVFDCGWYSGDHFNHKEKCAKDA